jgi:D-serine deaminase-like pyridoxal phosphate-dependent protein
VSKLFRKRELVQRASDSGDADGQNTLSYSVLASSPARRDHGAVTNALWRADAEPLETPVPLVDLDRLEKNLDHMATYARQHGLALRPHIKTHKSVRVAAEQIRRGAIGLTCATLREAEVMAEVSDDVLLAYPPVGASKLQRLLALPDHIELTVALDSIEVAEELARAATARGRAVGVYVELDVGMRRVGLSAIEEAVRLARQVAASPPLAYRGITFYPGHIRAPVTEQHEDIQQLARSLRKAIVALDRAGLVPDVVSGGSTPTINTAHLLDGLTEIRPGTYAFNDRITQQTGACTWDDCALTILATVVSTAVPGQAVVDAGAKALGREPAARAEDGFAALLDRPEVTVQRLSEEHGILDLGHTDWKPKVGEQVRLVPNHVCIAVHLHEVIYGVRGNVVETSWPVSARNRRLDSRAVGV